MRKRKILVLKFAYSPYLMKTASILIIIFTNICYTHAQKPVDDYAVIDRKALLIPDSLTKTTDQIAAYINSNFSDDKDKSRAAFIWVASNIHYDIDNMFAINFYEKKEEKITKPLKTRKGICINYASLFTEICIKSGLKSFVIEGYTKQNGFTDYIPHAWSAVLIDTTYFLFDPTWGSGYVNNGKFVRKINNDYYKATSSFLIKSHMPFDYLWQLLNYPVTSQEFYEGKIQPNKNKSFFNFKDSIQVFEKQSYIEQLTSSAYRVEKNGVKNSMIFDRLQHLKIEIENNRRTQVVNNYNSAVFDYNESINVFNEYINYKNKKFSPVRTDEEIQSMVNVPGEKLQQAKDKLSQISSPDTHTTNMVKQLTRSVEEAINLVSKEQEWLKGYFSKGKSGRKLMLFDKKVTWFGIPLN